MRLRQVTIEDAGQLASLLCDVGWFEAFKRENLQASIPRVKAQLAQCLADGSHSIYVAETDGGTIIGYAAVHWIPYLFMSGPEGYVSELFVHAGARSQGTGRRLLELVETEARRRGCVRLSLINLRQRESYRRQFYVKAGWKERSEAANFIYVVS